MNIFRKLFKNKRYLYCVACNQKHRSECFTIKSNSVGMCTDCYDKLLFTKKGSSFPALEPVDYLLSPLEYKNSAMDLLRHFKFRCDFKNSDIVNLIMSEFLKDYPHLSYFDLVIPVPLSAERLSERGYNQSEIIARGISEAIGVELDTKSLVRTRNTKRQSSVFHTERVINVKGAFSVNRTLAGKRIILVDDIYTTGNTMKNCAIALRCAGATDIVGITAATTTQKERPFLM